MYRRELRYTAEVAEGRAEARRDYGNTFLLFVLNYVVPKNKSKSFSAFSAPSAITLGDLGGIS
jgi:hypothetical protein